MQNDYLCLSNIYFKYSTLNCCYPEPTRKTWMNRFNLNFLFVQDNLSNQIFQQVCVGKIFKKQPYDQVWLHSQNYLFIYIVSTRSNVVLKRKTNQCLKMTAYGGRI